MISTAFLRCFFTKVRLFVLILEILEQERVLESWRYSSVYDCAATSAGVVEAALEFSVAL
jgi:hypothetical protein